MSAVIAVGDFGGNPVSRHDLETMCNASVHAHGVRRWWCEGNVGLARLDPYDDQDTPSRFHLTADARLDNQTELIAALQLPADASDTELILAAYARWGRDCPAHLIGDFAFVLWDPGERRFFAARDAVGVACLHVAKQDKLLLIAGEARSIVAHPKFRAVPSEAAYVLWLMNHYDSRHAMWEDILHLPPGYRLEADEEDLRIEPFINFSTLQPIHYQDPRDYALGFRERFDRAVRDRCRDEAPVIGTALSGGLDSSAVTASATACVGPNRIEAWSYQFDRLKTEDESAASLATARHLGIQTHLTPAEPYWIFKDALNRLDPMEDPFECWPLLVRRVFQELKDAGGRTFLTGHGGDSAVSGLSHARLTACAVLGGAWSQMPNLVRELRRHPKPLPRALFDLLLSPRIPDKTRLWLWRRGGRRPGKPDWLPDEVYDRFHLAETLYSTPPSPFEDPARTAVFHQMITQAAGVLRAVHWLAREAAPFGVRVRHPFLDLRLIRYLLAIPPEQFRAMGRPKDLTRAAFQNDLPKRILQNTTQPDLIAFYQSGITQELPRLIPLIQNGVLAARGLIQADRFISAMQDYTATPATRPADFLSALMTEVWIQREEQKTLPHTL